MRVFVLSPGRSGSMTFAKACSHLTNFTSGHESRAAGKIGSQRFDYPDMHIEVDNRLVWFLGELGARFDATDVFYVHLSRNTEATARSFLKRWATEWRSSIIRAFAHGVLMQEADWPDTKRLEVCRFYVQTVNANIREFVSSRRHIHVPLESVSTRFSQFLDEISAEGPLDAALAEWNIFHNAS